MLGGHLHIKLSQLAQGYRFPSSPVSIKLLSISKHKATKEAYIFYSVVKFINIIACDIMCKDHPALGSVDVAHICHGYLENGMHSML